MADNPATVFRIGTDNGNTNRNGTDTNRSGATNPTESQSQPESIPGLGGNFQESISSVAGNRGRKPRSKPNLAAAQSASGTIINAVEFAAMMRYGSPGKMAAGERKMIDESLSVCLSKLPIGISDQIGDITTPLMLGFGLLMYFSRLSRLEVEKRSKTTVDSVTNFINDQPRPPTTPPPNPSPERPHYYGQHGEYRTPTKEELQGMQEGNL